MNLSIIGWALPSAVALMSFISGGQSESPKPPDKPAVHEVVAASNTADDTCEQSLTGVTVIIDAGHGGGDPGSHTEIWGEKVWEASYTNDVALRLKSQVECRGGSAVLTVDGVDQVSNLPANQMIPINRDAKFAADGSQARAGKSGLRARLDMVDRILEQNSGNKVVWISIHFDSAGTSNEINGVHLLIPRSLEHDPLTLGLLNELQDEHRERTFERGGTRVESSVVINEDNRNVFILRASENRLRYRYLIELGNLADPNDSFRARSPEVREEYAITLANGLARGLS